MQKIRPPKTLQAMALDQIKELIITGELKQGEIYSAQYFSEVLGISRTPAREAMLQLVAEGFLVSLRGRGVQIREFSREEIQDYFEMRKLMELYVVEHLSNRISDAFCEQMQKRLDQMVDEKNAYLFLECDKRFHLGLINLYGNQIIANTMENIQNLMTIIGEKALDAADRLENVVMEHQAILEALSKRDFKLAVDAMRYHIETTEKHVLASHNP